MTTNDWKEFFSGLAMAEKAAADHCLYIANSFDKQNRKKLAREYYAFAQEEVGHYELVAKLVHGPIQITPKAKAIYAGELFQDKECVIERLAIVHLAFEPSALAFLGHLHVHANEYFEDPKEVEKIRQSFGVILREEVHHIMNGKELIVELLKDASEETKKRIKRSLRLHKAFLSLGLKSFFKNRTAAFQFIDEMLANYQMRFENLSREIA